MVLVRVLSMTLCLLQLVHVAAASPRPCRSPLVNKVGFRPQSVVHYRVSPSPGGEPFPKAFVRCVDRAFEAWTRANAATGLGVRFEPGPGGIVVQMDLRALALPARRAAGWAGGARDDEGFLERANVWLSSDRALLTSCDGVTKMLLHELGHLHGLADIGMYRGASVMNRAARRNDMGGRIPLAPTACDAKQAWRASYDAAVSQLAARR